MKKIKTLPEGWFSEKDIETYRNLFESLKDRAFVCELGVWKGRSICSVADIVIRKNLIVTCVDTFEGTVNEGEAHKEAKETDLRQEFLKTLNSFGLTPHVNIFKMTTDDAAKQFKTFKTKFHLVFIDADHSEKAVSKDIKNYLPLLRNKNSILAGHDLSWESVRNAIIKTLPDSYRVSHNNDNFWWISKELATKPKEASVATAIEEIPSRPMSAEESISGVTAVICTKDRYDYLQKTLLCIINQTVKPNHILIYDDSTNGIDMLRNFDFAVIFRDCVRNGIYFSIIPTSNSGQNKNHQRSIEKAITKYIWRVDDDLIVPSNTLESLLYIIQQGDYIGAVGTRVVTNGVRIPFAETSGKIQDVYTKAGLQLAEDGNGLFEAEHLHCSFIYNRTLGVNYHDSLSVVGHREETIFSHRLWRAGYKLIVDLDHEVYHSKAPSGGIRTGTQEMFESDELKFAEELASFPVLTPQINQDNFYAYLNCGIGDHFIFKNAVLKELIKNENKKITLFCCYPDVFFDIPNLDIKSIEEGNKTFTEEQRNKFNVYEHMERNGYKNTNKHIEIAFKEIYLTAEVPTVVEPIKLPKISIVIGTYNHLGDCLRPCIESIIKYTNLENVEIIVVPNGCTDGTVDYLNDLIVKGHPIKYFEHEEPLGFSAAYNVGIEEATGDYIVLLNNDTILLEQTKNDWLERLYTPFADTNRKVGATGPLKLWSEPANSSFIVFFCVMIKRELFKIIGNLDLDFGVGAGEDTAFCVEAEKAGYECVQVPESSNVTTGDTVMLGNFPIYHKGEATVGEIANWQEIFDKNSETLRKKYK